MGHICGHEVRPVMRLPLKIGGIMLRDTMQVVTFLRVMAACFQDIFVTVIE